MVCHKDFNRNSGFTLVELAIVLVIIGLIVSSVLVGQDLIKAAELRAVTKQQQEFQTAVNTFIGKYGNIPGDIEGDAFGLTGGCDAGTAGDGDANGILTELASASAITDQDGEIQCFWANLTTAGQELIAGTYDGDAAATVIGQHVPAMKSNPGSGWGVYGVSGVNYFTTGVSAGNAYNTTVTFAPLDAFNIDDKVDDGKPGTGNIQAVGAGANTPVAAATIDDSATPTATGECTYELGANSTVLAEYNIPTLTAACNLRIRMITF